MPKMNGSAPNCSATGSQVAVVTKSKPERPIASRAPLQSSSTRKPSRTGIASAASVSSDLEDPVAVAAALERRLRRRPALGAQLGSERAVMAGS